MEQNGIKRYIIKNISEEQKIENKNITTKLWRENNEEYYKLQRKEYPTENNDKIKEKN